ncbi:MAG TPA: DUF5695 domain-containing protein [Vicinamibacterales bacterium]|nr:DUF5695 domain-containing protein [Vicinamibacterales bacterium]
MVTTARVLLLAVFVMLLTLPLPGGAQQGASQGTGRAAQAAAAPTPGLEQLSAGGLAEVDGTLDFDTPEFTLRLVKDSQTIAALQPKGAAGFDARTPFDFTPADQLTARRGDRFNHLGDITLRVKQGNGAWIDLASSDARKPVAALASVPMPAGAKLLAAADLTPTLPEASPVQVTRSWQIDASGHLVLHFDLQNRTASPVTIGGLGFPVVFNNMIQNFTTNRARTLPEAHEVCSFFDPYVGLDAGYLQVTRLSGAGPALVVVPEPGTRTPFEAFRPLNDASRRGQTFEGAFEWTVASQGYAENEWKNVRQWNPPSSVVLKPGEARAFGLRFLLAGEIRHIERTLAANDRPVAVGIPGYIVPADIQATLLLTPGNRRVTNLEIEPAGALTVTSEAAAAGGQRRYVVNGKRPGRSRLTVKYSDGSAQSIHYYVTKPARQAISDLGTFLTTKAWYTDESDPFHRAPSPMTYDRARNRIVLQDTRVWVAGLSDEGGSGAWLAAMMKAFGQPEKAEVDKLSQFVDRVIWGRLQYSDGPRMYGVRKSLFYYQPDSLPDYPYEAGNWSTWTSWNKSQAEAVDRAYNYPHVVAAYWSMYRLARNYQGLVSAHPWEWYLDKAFNTAKYMTGGFAADGRGGVGYVNVGLMNGDIFVMLLDDLKRERWTEQAAYLEGAMKRRADRWNADAYPFGSEMAWDSTGQEEIFAWTNYFGYKEKSVVSLNSILGYMPTVPHWGYNGNARRYWDFFYGAAPGGTTERQIHHYGSGINAIPVLAQFRQHPDDLYLLRIGYGGVMGAIAAIDQDGFPSAAFHSYPQNLRWDTYTGDYGPNFFGHAVATATYVVNDPALGWQAFGGNLRSANGWITVQTLDSLRRRVYLAPVGLYLTLDAGTFENAALNPSTGDVRLTLSPSNAHTPSARLRIEQPATIAGVGAYRATRTYAIERGALVIPLQATAASVALSPK